MSVCDINVIKDMFKHLGTYHKQKHCHTLKADICSAVYFSLKKTKCETVFSLTADNNYLKLRRKGEKKSKNALART